MPKLAQRRPPAISATDWMQPLPPAPRFVLHGDARARERAASVWGAAFSQVPCRAIVAGARATLWQGPEEYLLLELSPAPAATAAAPGATDPDTLAQALEQALADVPHALVDVSHRQFALELMGPHAAAILCAGCPLDLDPREFPVGMCTRTVFAKADIVLWRTAAEIFHVEAWRSFAGYLGGALAEVAREYHPAAR